MTTNDCIPNIILQNLLKSKDDVFNICHINSCSLFPKLKYVQNLIQNIPISVLCITETWLKPLHSHKMVLIDGYRVVRHDRKRSNKTRGGGICLYIKENFTFRIIAKSAPDSILEFMFVEVKSKTLTDTLCIGCVYNPPKNNDLSEFSLAIDQHLTHYCNVVITGDFNFNILKTTPATEAFVQMMESFGTPIVNSEPTHFMPHCTPSCLDLFMVNDPKKVLLFDQVGITISDHDLIVLSYNIPIVKTPELKRKYRNFKKIVAENLTFDLINLPWENLYLLTDSEQQVQLFNSFIVELFEKHVPLQEIKNKTIPPNCPELDRAIADKDMAHRMWRRSRDPTDWEQFKTLRDIVNRLEKRELQKNYSKQFAGDLSQKQLWQNIKNLGLKDDNTQIPKMFTSESLNNKFRGLPSAQKPCENYNFNIEHLNHFSLQNVNQLETFLAINNIKSNATGADQISPKFIKHILPLILPYICHIFNTILTSSKFPASWKMSKVIPIPKTNSPKTLNDYRPISIVPFLSKAFERIVYNQLNEHIQLNNLLSPLQSGFRTSRSTTTALLSITNEVRLELDDKNISVLAFLDFSKAFDNVNQQKLLQKLHQCFNMSSSACTLINTYISDRTQYVYQHNDLSSNGLLYRGVPQGSVLGPLLFSLYINDLPQVIKHSNCHMFADDVQLNISGPKSQGPNLITHLNIDLASIHKWAEKNDLTLNPSKSTSIIISRSTIDSSSWPSIVVNNTVVNRSKTLKNLGIWFDESLKWVEHVTKLCGNVYGALRRLWKVAWLLPQETKIRLVQSLVVPIFTYGCTVFSNLSAKLKKKINVTFNACIRFAFGLKWRDSITPHKKKILGCTILNYFAHIACTTMFSLIRKRQPEYLLKFIIFSRSSRTFKLNQTRTVLKTYDGMFFIKGVSLWNSLPVAMRKITNFNSFKKQCLQHFSCQD